MREPSDLAKRIVAGLFLAAFLLCVINYQLELHLFGRFDKPAVGVLMLVGLALVLFIRPSTPRRPTFSWLSFAYVEVVMFGLVVLVGWRDYFEPTAWSLDSVAFLVIPSTISIVMARRWRLIRKELSAGTFSEERYRADSTSYILGPPRERRIWMFSSVAVVVILIFVQAVLAVGA